jgi:succinoglycan biosynthesis protein ExoM
MGEAQQHKAEAAVDVCVCTFRRASLWDTLASLALQNGAPPMRIIIADNDDTPSAAAVAARARAELGLDVHYVHAPSRNISIARNACLEAATAGLVAFIDDDEVATPGWLAALVSCITNYDAVFGPVPARYPATAPAWAVKGDFYTTRPTILAGGEIRTGYSGNVLIRRAAVGDLRFDPELGRVGGEDTMFFAVLHARGVKLGFAPEAVASEDLPANRLKLSWLLRRSFRAGQTAARTARMRGQGAAVLAILSGAKASYCAAATLLTLWSPVGVRRNLIRGALHVGALAKVLGAKDLTMYGAASPGAPQSVRSTNAAQKGV